MQLKRISIILIITLFFFPSFGQKINTQVYKFANVIAFIEQFYVDTVNTSRLVEDAIRKMVSELDPHSDYLTPEEVKEMNEPLQGGFEGIGIQFNVLYDTIFVINPISGGPSEKVGILAGDRIIKINNENVAGIGISAKDVRKRLMGPKGTQVKVSIKRRGVNELLDFTITRDKIPIYSLDAAYKVNDSTLYIRLNQFSASTMEEIYSALTKLNPENKQINVILDLRNNGGGLLNVAYELADEFLPNGKLIVYTKGLNSPKREYIATPKGRLTNGRLVVMVDEGSASASEIVSGAIQDWDRGVIIGRRTFGKGLVQRPFDLPDGSMLKLTVAKYYTPSGRLIQKYYQEGKTDEYEMDILNRFKRGELFSTDSINFPDSLKYTTLLNKRIVYGGGGIMPDYFVPLDTSSITNYYKKIIQQGILNRFVYNYIDNNRKSLQKEYPDFKKFNKKFVVTDGIIDELVDFAKNREKLEPNFDDINKDKEDIKLLIKAYIARDMWNTSEFYEIFNANDKAYLKAIEIINNPKIYYGFLQKTK
jgi:carboxyl-terminal processing protease